jgi:hypothetical protein
LLSNMEVCHIGGGVGITFWGINRADLRQIEPGTYLTLHKSLSPLSLTRISHTRRKPVPPLSRRGAQGTFFVSWGGEPPQARLAVDNRLPLPAVETSVGNADQRF